MVYDSVRRKQWRVAAEMGRPARMQGPEVQALVRKIKRFHARGMSYRTMSEQTGVAVSVITVLVKRGDACLRTSYDKLSRLRYAESEGRGARVPSLGVTRRLQALWAAGYSLEYLKQELGSDANDAYLRRSLHGGPRWTHAEYAARIRRLYQKLESVDPMAAGMTKHGVTYARNAARKRGYAPPQCWDDDTIDDPQASPEWTGACGTEQGLHIHYRDRILPACRPCLDARGPRLDNPVPRFSGSKLTAIRNLRGLELADLAEKLGVSKSSVAYWESGRMSPRRGRFDQLCLALSCNEIDLCEDP